MTYTYTWQMTYIQRGIAGQLLCLFSGVIRAINMDARCFYVVTPLPKEKLAEVNALVKGDIPLPSTVFKCQQVRIFYSVLSFAFLTNFFFQIAYDGKEIRTDLPYLTRDKKSLGLDDDELVLKEMHDMKRRQSKAERRAAASQKSDEIGFHSTKQWKKSKEKIQCLCEKATCFLCEDATSFFDECQWMRRCFFDSIGIVLIQCVWVRGE